MSSSEAARARERRAARASWPVRRYPLGGEPPDDLGARTTPQERLAMMWPLAVQAWTLSGRDLPEYRRSETPVSTRPLRPGR